VLALKPGSAAVERDRRWICGLTCGDTPRPGCRRVSRSNVSAGQRVVARVSWQIFGGGPMFSWARMAAWASLIPVRCRKVPVGPAKVPTAIRSSSWRSSGQVAGLREWGRWPEVGEQISRATAAHRLGGRMITPTTVAVVLGGVAVLPGGRGHRVLLAWKLHLPPISAVPLVSDIRFRRSAQRLARLT
jgi:hypothetical protein